MELKAPKVGVTFNYDMFTVADDNRPLNLSAHRALKRNMQEDGFNPGCPIICIRRQRKLIVKDGQHRLQFARELELPVYWIEVEEDFDVAKLNSAQKGWVPTDYASKFSESGSADYKELLQFKEDNEIPMTLAAALLAGTTGFAAVSQKFYAGEFKITDREYARSVVGVYLPITKIDKKLKHQQFLLACMAVGRVSSFSLKRLVSGIDRCRGKIVMYGNRDLYLVMLEEIYNHGQKNKSVYPLKIEAVKAMRERNPKTRTKKTDAAHGEAA